MANFAACTNKPSTVPEYASALETMRYRGHELHYISLIDHHFRKLCNEQIHYVCHGLIPRTALKSASGD